MKRVLVVVALLIGGALGVDVLGDLTQSRPDPVRAGAVTELVVRVEQDRFAQGDDAAAEALWAVCAGQTTSRPATTPVALDGGRYRIVLAPAVGENEERKLRGCLEDLTVDRVLGDVVSWRTIPVGGGGGSGS
jgi:hypothetical protein